ncbi:MAG TPA: response regulator [Oscillatoriaceae cyanobacterium M33_DOE_052]|uniref:Protein PatA n=1 Tax=Planktothricoides sp. SpSt-374 TaxID=2282167 RepID=A0A7C3ZQ14_9CYAN|nr:response regulator [Oscillatoriaceae cyanobacterium M33_DOE_052]
MTSTANIATEEKTTIQSTNSPAKVLQNIVQKKITGRLTVADPKDNSIYWRIYFGNGSVNFAHSAVGQKERLEYLLHRYYPQMAMTANSEFKSDYDEICRYWKAGNLSLQEARKILFCLTQEALVQVLALPQAVVHFDKTVGLDPILLSVPLKEVVLPMRGLIAQWQQLNPEISSPFQRFGIKNLEQFAILIRQKIKDVTSIKTVAKVINENPSLYEAAKHLKTDALALAAMLQPLVKAGAVSVSPYQTPKTNNGPIIACIDDSKTVHRNVKLILEAAGYRVLSITEPAKALTALARHKPALVLMDINMPDINGYELSRLLRQSTQLRHVPIVMLTGRDGLVDKLRAKAVGAQDYVTKPFNPDQLLQSVANQIAASQKQQGENLANVATMQVAYS